MNLWTPCQSDKCGGAHAPAVLKRIANTSYPNGPFVDFPPANYIWQPQYNDIFANGDGQYLFPCEDGPCGTIRLSSIRDGLEDWEMFSALGAAKAVPLLKRLVRSSTDWTEDPALLEATRRDAASMLHEQQQMQQQY